ncbi:hypothetical protein [Mycoplasma crocodyli]|uniref:Uncharacterized protein n=1 Tax=Mycoplasma crocodyli (strain ATCC 51981 / MP145) TaxID=512564 RepID=D5E645_MYCCM|nr:hypothetical protein [Mycoplasma crocodyli]ADE19931.1 hypothetical protein MCRO_0630 [Mycoplasma crocodyli MP145]
MIAYKIDGTPHKNGVSFEELLTNFLNECIKKQANLNCFKNVFYEITGLKFNSFHFQHIGGTKSRSDIHDTINNLNISIKSKKIEDGKIKGTFDLINTTHINEILVNNKKFSDIYFAFSKVKKTIKEFDPTKITNTIIKEIRTRISYFCSSLLSELTNKDLFYIFNKYKENTNDFTMLNLYEKEHEINKENLYLLNYSWYRNELIKLDFTTINNNSKTSFNLLYKDGTKSPFRIRVVLNNGLSPLIGRGRTEILQ